MFCANILLHNTSFEPKSSLARNMAFTTNISLGTKKQGLFFTFITYTSPKRENFKSHTIEHYNSLHGCIVKLIKGARQSS
jgi:hypothetical protein